MKKIIYFIGIVFLVIVAILNLTFTAKLDSSEHINISHNTLIYIIGLLILGISIFLLNKLFYSKLYDENNNRKKKIRKILFAITIILYVLFNIIWCIVVRPAIVGDQIHACNLAQTFYSGNDEEFLPNITYAGIPLIEYMQAYHQQLSLAFVFSTFFRIIHFDGIDVLRVLNVIGNVFILIALYKISKQLNKEYKINKLLVIFLITTFISLTMLNTFIYGDIPSIALCLFSVYFMMKYTETEKIKYPIIASLLTMVAFMMRMNSLIFIIATVIYLLLNLFNNIKNRTVKENFIKLLIIVIYIVISIMPSNFVKNYYINKYNLDKDKAYPNISYFLMAMEKSDRGNGWYNESIGEPALKEPQNKKVEYVDKIKERVKYFSQHIDYAFDFYTMKIASMWTENTYSAVRNNMEGQTNQQLENIINPLTFYQKTLLILMSVCSLVVLIQNRKNLSLNLIFLLTIFIGGFSFHILWEAKSRYIIPYILVLIPIASININNTIKDNITRIYNYIKSKK